MPPMLDIDFINPCRHKEEFYYPGKSASGFLVFQHVTEWRDYLLSLQIQSTNVPTSHVRAFHDALRLMLLAWIEPATIKSAELQALRSLEAALTGMYFQSIFEREQTKHKKAREKCGGCKKCVLCSTLSRDKFKPWLEKLLDYMAAHDDLDPKLHNECKKKTGSALNVIRNGLAHGNVFNTLPWGGLFESVKAVMEHAYRNSGIDTSLPMPIDCPTPSPRFGLP